MKSTTSTMIINSILWAAAMLASAIVLKGSGYYENIFFILFTLWMASFLMLPANREAIECERKAIHKFFNQFRKSK